MVLPIAWNAVHQKTVLEITISVIIGGERPDVWLGGGKMPGYCASPEKDTQFWQNVYNGIVVLHVLSSTCMNE